MPKGAYFRTFPRLRASTKVSGAWVDSGSRPPPHAIETAAVWTPSGPDRRRLPLDWANYLMVMYFLTPPVRVRRPWFFFLALKSFLPALVALIWTTDVPALSIL